MQLEIRTEWVCDRVVPPASREAAQRAAWRLEKEVRHGCSVELTPDSSQSVQSVSCRALSGQDEQSCHRGRLYSP